MINGAVGYWVYPLKQFIVKKPRTYLTFAESRLHSAAVVEDLKATSGRRHTYLHTRRQVSQVELAQNYILSANPTQHPPFPQMSS